MRNTVDKLWTHLGKILKVCAVVVYKDGFLHSHQMQDAGFSHITHNQFTALMNNFFARFTDKVYVFYTPSTLPIKTTKYIKKEY